MAKRKVPYGKIPVNRDVPVELWRRFEALAETMVPRVSMTALLEAAIAEYIQNHEPKGGKR